MARWKHENPSSNTLAARKFLNDPKSGEERRAKAANSAREWRKRNPEYSRQIQQRSYDKIRRECFEAYGGLRCKCCGESEILFLHLDHINGDGSKQRKLWESKSGQTFGGTAFYYYLKKNNFPDLKLQVLCANCNLGKRTKKYCPHELNRGMDMNGSVIQEEELKKPYPVVSRRLRGEAEKEANNLGISKATLRMRRWREREITKN